MDLGVSPAALTGLAAREIGDRIAEALRPADGTQDAEAARDAISRAISDLIAELPNVDLLALSPEQIAIVVERYVAHDLCRRIELDVGKAILDKAPNYAEGVRRMEEMRQYVREKVANCFRARAAQGQRLTRTQAASLTGAVLQDTFQVFEDYLQ